MKESSSKRLDYLKRAAALRKLAAEVGDQEAQSVLLVAASDYERWSISETLPGDGDRDGAMSGGDRATTPVASGGSK